MKRLFLMTLSLSLSAAAFAQEAPQEREPDQNEKALDPDTVIRRAGQEEDEGAVASTKRVVRNTGSALKRLVEGEQVRRELEEVEQIEPRPLHPEDKVAIRTLRYLIKKRAALREKSEGVITDKEKEALEDIDDEIEKMYEALGRDSYIRAKSSGLGFLRIEHRRNRLNRKRGDDDTFIPLRADIGLEVGLKRLGRLVAIASFSRTHGANDRIDKLSDRHDLFEAYYEPHFFHGRDIELTPRIGRQVLRYGNQRLLGDDGFNLFHRSFDAARLDLKMQSIELSAFAGQVVRRADLTDASFNESSDDERLFGSYNTIKFGDALRLELFGLRKDIDRPGLEISRINSFGARLIFGGGEGVGFEIEGIMQTGRLNGVEHRAYAGSAALTYTALFDQLDPEIHEDIDPRVIAKANRVPKAQIRFGVDWASGDDDPLDGRSGTFQPVYPSQHEFQGDADVLGFQNVIDLHASVSYSFRGDVSDDADPALTVQAAYHYFQRDTRNDAAYDPAGLVIAPGNGFGSRELGQEIDVRVTFFGCVSVGWARFFPGGFLEDAGRDDPVDYFYLAIP